MTITTAESYSTMELLTTIITKGISMLPTYHTESEPKVFYNNTIKAHTHIQGLGEIGGVGGVDMAMKKTV